MLFKQPKSTTARFIKKGIIGVIAAETLFFGVSFALWYGINTKREYRKYLHDHFPKGLELYYQVGEKFDSDLKRIRELDYAYWEKESR